MELLNIINLALLYVLYVLGCAAGILNIFSLLIIVISNIALVNAASEGDNVTAKHASRAFIYSLIFFALSAFILAVLPPLNELKAAAVYKVSHEADTSEVSQKTHRHPHSLYQ